MEHDIEDLDFFRLEREAFAKCPNVAIHVAVVEKPERGIVLSLVAGWSDLALWSALCGTPVGNADGNLLQGRLIGEGRNNCNPRSEYWMLVGLWVENLVVVETDDALLISDGSQAQAIRTAVKQLKADGCLGNVHLNIYRLGARTPVGWRAACR